MNWSDVGKTIESVAGKAAPLLGGLLGGPAGAAVGSMISSALGTDNSPDAISAAIKADPSAAAKLAEVESNNKVELQKLAVQAEANRLAADTQRIQAVNTTMQTEAKSEHWAQWLWRPFNGFLFGPALICIYFVLPILHLPVPSISADTWMMWGAVLGVTAWHRGVNQRIQNGDKSISATVANVVKSQAGS